jgi:protocatechuate 3,4-dioxygenase beta subunit
MTSVTPSPSSLNRRAALRLISGTTLALLGTRFTFADAGGAAISPAPSLLTPEATEGPFYIGSERIRRDITEGKPGVPLRLRIQVLQLNTAAPVSHAAVDIWHCDAQGVYSGFNAHLGPPYGGKFPTIRRPSCAVSR